MKELSIEEKAKAYDEAIERAKAYQGLRSEMEIIFPELKESEDERIIKSIIELLNEVHFTFKHYDINKMLSWLEKQGEQKPADKIEPKFKVGDIIRHKEQGFTCKIIAVDTEYRLSECNGTHLPFDSQDAYELVEQKPAWSEEDKCMLNNVIDTLKPLSQATRSGYSINSMINWLKSLKDRLQLK